LAIFAAIRRAKRLSCLLKSTARSPVGQPIAFLSNRQISLASFANWLSGWSNVMAHDFVHGLAGRTEIEKVIQGSKPLKGANQKRKDRPFHDSRSLPNACAALPLSYDRRGRGRSFSLADVLRAASDAQESEHGGHS
jgi:hypothetical protein